MKVQQAILRGLSDASTALLNAYGIAVKANPMAQDLGVFQEMMKLQKEINFLMQGVSKVRGLDGEVNLTPSASGLREEPQPPTQLSNPHTPALTPSAGRSDG